MYIQQLRAQIAALQDSTMDENKNFRSTYDEGKFDALTAVDALLDSLQEEPVSIWHDASKKSDNSEDVVIINPSDNTGEVLTKCTGVNQGHIWAYTSELLKLDNPCNIGKNLQEPQVKESAEIQHVNETCKENGNSLTQEPVSDDLEEAADDALNSVLNTHEIVNVRSCLEMFRFGANWQKEQMMAKAIDATVTDIRTYREENEIDFTIMLEKGIVPYELEEELKVIVIKED